MSRLTIDIDAVAGNWRKLAEIHRRPIAAVVKADGYGLGARAVAPRLLAEGCRHFFVAHPGEGAALRPVVPGAAIAILNGLPAGEAARYSEHELIPVLGRLADLSVWQAHARSLGRQLPALLHVDTGMNRLGLDPDELATLAREPARLDGIELRYLMTHLSNAEMPADPRNQEQLARFRDACERLPSAPRSVANSSGIFLGPEFRSDLARPGVALYGANPTPGQPNPMQPTFRLQAQVLQLRDIETGEPVGYNGIWIAPRPTRVATVSIGYADGYHRCLSNRAEAHFDRGRLPLIGRVSMDLVTFDATDHPDLRPGDWLEMIGPAVPPDEVAGWAGTNAYEIMTSLGDRGGQRCERLYAAL